MEEVEMKTSGGILIPEQIAEKEEMKGIVATVVSVGPSAWADQTVGGKWASPGDKVMIAKFAGQIWKNKGIKYRVINDLDVIAVLNEGDLL
jgi:co-chaperonin GroES (HSP10)